MITEFKYANGIDISNDAMAMQRLMDAAETAKKELSSTVSTEINLPFLTADASGPKHLVSTLTRAKFDSMISDMVDDIIKHINAALEQARLTKTDIKEIVMVGGSTRIPLIKDKVSEFFNGKTLNNSVNPDEVVAGGAAIQGGVLRGDVKDVLLLDVTPLSLGIETLGGVMTPVIEKGTTIPTSKTQTFSTAQDNQPGVSIMIYQGVREFAKDNKLLGNFELGGIMPAPKGVPQIEIRFDVDSSGVLNVSAKDKATGKENSITITGSSGLSDAEIEKMIQDAEANKYEDQEKKKKVDSSNSLDSTIYQAEKFIKENEHVETSDLKVALESAKIVFSNESSTIEDLDNAKETLMAKFQEIGTKMYEQQTSNPDYTEASASPDFDENVVDAEFTEK